MTYIHKILKTKPNNHQCDLPDITTENLDVSTMWLCDDCKQIWRVVYDLDRLPYKESLKWTKDFKMQ